MYKYFNLNVNIFVAKLLLKKYLFFIHDLSFYYYSHIAIIYLFVLKQIVNIFLQYLPIYTTKKMFLKIINYLCN